MIAVEVAKQRIFEAIDRGAPIGSETLPLAMAAGRVLSQSIHARLTQPPLAVSAMDGWAVRSQDCQATPTLLQSVGEVAAGQIPTLGILVNQCQRIFTGAPIPGGADAVIVQENTTVLPDGRVECRTSVLAGQHIRQAGIDFMLGEQILTAPKILTARDLSLAAAANHPTVEVFKRPRIGIISTGSELIAAGQTPRHAAEIISSNSHALAALIRASGGEAIDLGIVSDQIQHLSDRIDSALAQNLQMVVTIGGASVGDYDLVQSVMASRGMVLDFWKIAMRPGKPLIFGHLPRGNLAQQDILFLGLPGNPVSCFICALVFLRPAIERFMGLELPLRRLMATSRIAIKPNDERREFQRAALVQNDELGWQVTPASRNDSSLHTILAAADCLIERPPFAAAVAVGGAVEVLLLPSGF